MLNSFGKSLKQYMGFLHSNIEVIQNTIELSDSTNEYYISTYNSDIVRELVSLEDYITLLEYLEVLWSKKPKDEVLEWGGTALTSLIELKKQQAHLQQVSLYYELDGMDQVETPYQLINCLKVIGDIIDEAIHTVTRNSSSERWVDVKGRVFGKKAIFYVANPERAATQETITSNLTLKVDLIRSKQDGKEVCEVFIPLSA